MKDNFKKGIVLIFALLFSALIFAQEDSTDINFYAEPFVPLTLEDSLIVQKIPYAFYYLEFDITDTVFTDTSGFAGMSIQVGNHYKGTVIFSSHYTLSELQSNQFILGWHVKIPLGKLPSNEVRRLGVLIERSFELSNTNSIILDRKIIKTL